MIDEDKIGNGNGHRRAVEIFRFITPVLVMVSLFILSGIKSDVKDIDTKLFTHLTNHELHIPRQDVVTQAEFQLHSEMSKESMNDFKATVKEMTRELKEYVNVLFSAVNKKGRG